MPEKATAYELGYKGSSIEDRLSYSLALFDEEFKDLQAIAFVGSSAVTLVTNVGKARSRGVESGITFAPIRPLRINGTLTYTDAVYVDFPGGVCTRAQAAASGPSCQQDLSGSPTPFSSKWAATIGADFQRGVGLLYRPNACCEWRTAALDLKLNPVGLLAAGNGRLSTHPTPPK